ncbi:hypothetical protein SeLEV6574_g06660 [Synchytrium endobioticum]|uniref:Uncharacterized protein n=1 Tax=Synchytrium endobioticum TaxID=286115 RepID=A0A507CFQ3_9FUNG|nr:hypothetical protein SeLEV6574_g06660 [Synchytrium endobioticum]
MQDLDELFAYQTYKVVNIKDRRLGLLYLAFEIAIAVYVLWNIFSSGLYLIKTIPITGSIRISFQIPTGYRTLPTPSYCAPSSFSSGCMFLNAEQVVFPYAGQQGSVFITTRISVSNTGVPPPGCSYATPLAATYACSPPAYNTLPSATYYVANVERYTLMIDHAVRGQITSGLLLQATVPTTIGTTTTSAMMGRLVAGCTGAGSAPTVLQWNETVRAAALASRQSGDTMTVGELLTAADCAGNGIDLDANSTSITASVGESIRSTGAIISMPIIYSNRQTTGAWNDLKYEYIPALIGGEEYKIIEKIPQPDGSITYWNRHGVQVTLTQTGTIGQFNFLSFLSNLVGGLALLKVATTITEMLMMYGLPQRKLYREAKVEQTEDFSDVRQELKEIKRRRRFTQPPSTAAAESPNGPPYNPNAIAPFPSDMSQPTGGFQSTPLYTAPPGAYASHMYPPPQPFAPPYIQNQPPTGYGYAPGDQPASSL